MQAGSLKMNAYITGNMGRRLQGLENEVGKMFSVTNPCSVIMSCYVYDDIVTSFLVFTFL